MFFSLLSKPRLYRNRHCSTRRKQRQYAWHGR
nr:MAG TPA: hypothetical protein [Caudoviricetes sp.]